MDPRDIAWPENMHDTFRMIDAIIEAYRALTDDEVIRLPSALREEIDRLDVDWIDG